MFKRRLGSDPHAVDKNTGLPRPTPTSGECPDIWELENGDIAVIGVRKTDILKSSLPASAGCSLEEEIVIVPRSVFLSAKDDIAGLK